ncbi:MAG: hypothetical protein QM726_18820 [Chitinophagaceae bacterium]
MIFLSSFEKLYYRFKKGVRSIGKRREDALRENPSYVHRFDFLDSTHARLIQQVVSNDTVYINNYDFQLADIGTGYDFVDAIKKNKCIIIDNNKIRQYIILIQKYSQQKGMLDGWGGRLFFLPGKNQPFIAETDWVS